MYKVKYKIVTADNLNILGKEVSKYLNKGYERIGYMEQIILEGNISYSQKLIKVKHKSHTPSECVMSLQ